MTQLTVRGFDEELAEKIRSLARREGISLNKAALRLLRCGAGLGESQAEAGRVGPSLDHLCGTWSEKDEREFLEAVSRTGQVDEEMWR